MKPLLGFLFFCVCSLTACKQESSSPISPEAPKKNAKPSELSLPPRDNTEPRLSPNAMVSQTMGTTVVTVSYGRPAVKGRKVFGVLEKYGEVWRAGANEATVFATSQDLQVNGQVLKAGVYAFFIIPTEREWTVIFNSQADQWGGFNQNKNLDVLRLKVMPNKIPPKEWLSYTFDPLSDKQSTLLMEWDDVQIALNLAAIKP